MKEITAEMLREAYRQTQREILEIATPERYEVRWQRMAELLNEKLAQLDPDASVMYPRKEDASWNDPEFKQLVRIRDKQEEESE